MNRSLVFKFFGIDAGAGREFDKMAAKSEATKHAIGAFALGTAAAAATVGVVSIGMAAKFQTSMTLLHTQAGASTAEVKKMSSAVLALAGPTATAPAELAKGLYHIESTGIRGAKALQVLKVAAEGAKIGGANLEDVTNALNAAVVSGIPGVHNVSKAMGTFNAIVGSGDMRMQDLADAFAGTGLLTSVKGFGISLNDVAGALATFGDNGIRGKLAATQFRMAVQSMAKPAAGGADALKKIGLSSTTLAKDMQAGGLRKAIDDLHSHLLKAGDGGKKMGQTLVTAFGKKAGVGIATLEQEVGRLHNKLGEAQKGATGFFASWTGYNKTFGASWDRAKASAEALLIAIGTKLLPVATRFTTWISAKAIPALSSFGGWVKRNKAWLTPLVLVIGTAVAVGFTIVKVIKLWTAAQAALNLMMDANPIGLVVIAVAALAVGLIYAWKHSETFRNIVKGAFRDVKIAAKAVADFFTGPFIHGVGIMVSYFIKGAKFLVDVWFTTVGLVLHGAEKMMGWVPGIGGKIKGAVHAFDSFRSSVDTTMSGVAADASSWGEKTGANLAIGVDNGLAAFKGRVQSNGYRFGLSVANAVRVGAAVKSPSRITVYVGKMLAEGIVVGFKGASAHVLHSLSAATQSMVAAIGGRVDHWLGRFRSRVLSAKNRLSADMAARSQMAAGIRDNLTSGSDLTNAFGQDANGNTVLGNIGSFLAGNLGSLKRFLTDLNKLRKMGLAPRLLAMIANAGPDQGISLAEQIISGQAGSVGSLNGQSAAIVSTSQAIGNVAAGATYDSRIAKDRKVLHDQLASQKRAERLLHGIITAILSTATTPEGLAKALRKLKRELGHDLGLA